MHGAELRSAHRAELRALEVLGGESLVVVLARPLRIEAEPELLVPVELVPRFRQRVVAIASAFAATRDVRRVRRDLVRDHAVADILRIRQAQMLLDRKSTRLNSSHGYISYAVFCLK